MFAPMGNKKVLLKIKRARSKGVPLKAILKEEAEAKATAALAKSGKPKRQQEDEEGSPSGSPTKNGNSTSKQLASVASSQNLHRLLKLKDLSGKVIRQLMEATTHYRADRDTIIAKAFQAAELPYGKFREFLKMYFAQQYTDAEFEEMLLIFDPNKCNFIDGFEFMRAVVKLGGIRKDRELAFRQSHQESIEKQKAEAVKRKEAEEIKRIAEMVDFKYSEGAETNAIEMLTLAAKRYDQTASGAKSLKGFDVATMDIPTFKDMIRRIFDLVFTPAELGAVLDQFEHVKKDNGTVLVDCKVFLRFFLKLGIYERQQERMDAALSKQRADEQLKREEEMRAKERMGNKEEIVVDHDFTDVDEARAREKLMIAATKYDQNSSSCLSLDGFEPSSVKIPLFRELLRRTFNLHLTPKEMGALVRKYDKEGTGNINCQGFLVPFLKMGKEQRRKMELHQISASKMGLEQIKREEKAKMEELANRSSNSAITPAALENCNFQDEDLNSAILKLQAGSLKYDKARGGSLKAFDAQTMKAGLFSDMLKQIFNINLTLRELAAIVQQFDKNNTKEINCSAFLVSFFKLGQDERFRLHSEQIAKQRELDKIAAEEAEKKRVAQKEKAVAHLGIEADFDFTEDDMESALAKMTNCAHAYDKTHAASATLDGFETNFLTAREFYNLVKRCFKLVLNAKELGALVSKFDKNKNGTVICSDFLNQFFKLGFDYRAEMHKKHLIQQRRENKLREQEELRKLYERGNKHKVEFNLAYGDATRESAIQKLTAASVKYDKYHPAAPSLAAFEHGALMTPSVFKENIRKSFNIVLNDREMAFIISEFVKKTIAPSSAIGEGWEETRQRADSLSGTVDTKDKKAKENLINSADFLTKFLLLGIKERNSRHVEQLEKQRKMDIIAKEESEKKMTALAERAAKGVLVDFSCGTDDRTTAFEKLSIASEKFDKNHPAAPSLKSFEYGFMKPGVFREALRKCFNIWLTPKELGALIQAFLGAGTEDEVDPKLFLIEFMKLGVAARARAKSLQLEEQRRSEAEAAQEQYRKQRILNQKTAVDVDPNFESSDRSNAITKLTMASAKYDRNAPGCVSLDMFVAAFLTPMQFREAVKNTFNVTLTPRELSAMIKEFATNDKSGNVDCAAFVRAFLRYGVEERNRNKAVQLDKQHRMNYYRKTEHERKLKELESKITVDIQYDVLEEHEISAFDKLAAAAVKYDKNNPGAVSLEGFNAQTITPAVFRELLKRTFNVVLTPYELGACVKYFEYGRDNFVEEKEYEANDNTIPVDCKAFLVHFFQLGFSGRSKERAKQLRKQRDDNAKREREAHDKLAGQWAKTNVEIDYNFSVGDEASAFEKIHAAAEKFDPTNPGPIGLKAFKSSDMGPGVLREMIRRSFNITLTNKELGAVVKRYDTHNKNVVDGKKFVSDFCRVGCARRDAIRKAKLEKNREFLMNTKVEQIQKLSLAEKKMEVAVDFEFSKEDFTEALGFIRNAAAHYDPNHPSAPSLKGFHGSNMKPSQFKDMLYRTFKITLTPAQLGALVKFFDLDDSNTLNAKEFLTHFAKYVRQEQSKARKLKIEAERKLRLKAQEYEECKEEKKLKDEVNKLSFDRSDEKSALKKLRSAAQEVATDTGSFTDALKDLKGPVMSAASFRDAFNRIFLIKFTYPEVGALLHYLDPTGKAIMDGGVFYKAFLRLSRVEEWVFLGEVKDKMVTLDLLKPGSQLPERRKPTDKISVFGRKKKKVEEETILSSSDEEESSSEEESGDESLENSETVKKTVGNKGDVTYAGAEQISRATGKKGHRKSYAKDENRPDELDSGHGGTFNKKTKEQDPAAMKKAQQQRKLNPKFKTDEEAIDYNHKQFNKSTLAQNWILPSVAGSVAPAEKNGHVPGEHTGMTPPSSGQGSRNKGSRGASRDDDNEFMPYDASQIGSSRSTRNSTRSSARTSPMSLPSAVANDGSVIYSDEHFPANAPPKSTGKTVTIVEGEVLPPKETAVEVTKKPVKKEKVKKKPVSLYIPASLDKNNPKKVEAKNDSSANRSGKLSSWDKLLSLPSNISTTAFAESPSKNSGSATGANGQVDDDVDFLPLMDMLKPPNSPGVRGSSGGNRGQNKSRNDNGSPLKALITDIVDNGHFISNIAPPKSNKFGHSKSDTSISNSGMNSNTLSKRVKNKKLMKLEPKDYSKSIKNMSKKSNGFLFPTLLQTINTRTVMSAGKSGGELDGVKSNSDDDGNVNRASTGDNGTSMSTTLNNIEPSMAALTIADFII